METPMHSMSNLFDQLGLPSDTEAIERFIDTHSPFGTRHPARRRAVLDARTGIIPARGNR